MIFGRVFLSLFAVFFLLGCEEKAKNRATTQPEVAPAFPTRAQPKLPTVKLWIGGEEMIAEMARTGIEQQTGLMFRTNIPENEGMIFVLPSPQRASFWMKNCPESISAAYISADGVIREIHHLEKQNTNSVVATNDNIHFVLETKEGWFQRHNINPGVVVRTESGSLEKTFLKRN